MIELVNGDCVGEIEKLIEQGIKVDCIITDPPYFISKENNFKTMGRAGIDFGTWDKGNISFIFLDEFKKILTKNGSAIIFYDWKKISYLIDAAEKAGFICKDILRFEKTNPMPRNRDRRYISDTEYAVWFTTPKAKWVFNRQMDSYQRPKFVSCVERGYHPTQKPVSVMEDIIKIHTTECMTILDPFAGSGTTGVACINTNRNFIGIELNKEYFDVAKERINNKIRKIERK